MSYLGIIKLEANLTFYVNTHTPSTSAAVDADAVPGYRIYKDETGTPLLTGSMALLDDANTVGFYSEQIAVTAANGFEAGKSYCIRITGVVAAATGVELHQFDVTTRDMDDLPTASAIADAVHDEVVEGAYTLRHYLRLLAAVLFGKATGGGTTAITFRDTADGTDRVVMTVDASGDRSAVTLDAS